MGLPVYETTFFAVTVTGETSLPNGHKYFILRKHRIIDEHDYYEYRFERVDSLSGNVFRYNDDIDGSECLIDSLRSQAGDSSRADRRYCSGEDRPVMVCSRDTSEYLFDDPRRIKYFECCADFIISCPEYSLAEHLGLYELYYEFDFGSHRESLIYAEIDNRKYGASVLLSLDNITGSPADFQLFQNYPNPFNPSTTISYSLLKSGFVTFKIYDVNGREVHTLVDEFQYQGNHSVIFDADGLSSGVYFYTIQVGNNFVQTKKMIFLK
jgi:hypothetical protein